MKIDMHVHITPPDLIKDYQKIGEREPYFQLLSSSPQNKFVTAEEVIMHMEQVGVDHSIVFGFGFQDMGLCQYVNDYVIEMTKKYKRQLTGFAAVVPQHPKVEQEIERCYLGGLRGIGELFPIGQNFKIEELAHTGPMASCSKHYQIPILLHTNEPIGHHYIGKTPISFNAMETFITHHPDQPIILAHWGGGIFTYELMKEIKEKFKNVYYDTAAMVFLYEKSIYDVAKAIGIQDKILFGSDYPLVSPKRYEKGLSESTLTPTEQVAILGENARSLFERCQVIL